MKHETKYKIISFVRRLLNYKPTAENGGKIEVDYKSIVHIRSQQSYSRKEIIGLSLEQLQYHAQLNLMSELHKHGMIKYETRANPHIDGDFHIFEASLKVIKP